MAKPSWKSEDMEKAIAGVLGQDRRTGIEANLCVPPPIGCGKSATKFRDAISKREFTISGLCQECQDEVFGA